MEPYGTPLVMAGRPQVKFYADKGLIEACESVFQRQGMTKSEGYARLMQLAVEATDELRPVLFRQAQGDAAVLLAKEVLKKQEQPEIRKTRKKPMDVR